MGQQIVLNLASADAQKLKEMGRDFYGDSSLGIPQSCGVLLAAIASGEYELVKVKKRSKKVEEKPPPEEEEKE